MRALAKGSKTLGNFVDTDQKADARVKKKIGSNWNVSAKSGPRRGRVGDHILNSFRSISIRVSHRAQDVRGRVPGFRGADQPGHRSYELSSRELANANCSVEDPIAAKKFCGRVVVGLLVDVQTSHRV